MRARRRRRVRRRGRLHRRDRAGNPTDPDPGRGGRCRWPHTDLPRRRCWPPPRPSCPPPQTRSCSATTAAMISTRPRRSTSPRQWPGLAVHPATRGATGLPSRGRDPVDPKPRAAPPSPARGDHGPQGTRRPPTLWRCWRARTIWRATDRRLRRTIQNSARYVSSRSWTRQNGISTDLLGVRSQREVSRARYRTMVAMRAQAEIQGRHLSGRPPYGYRLADAGPASEPGPRWMGATAVPVGPGSAHRSARAVDLRAAVGWAQRGLHRPRPETTAGCRAYPPPTRTATGTVPAMRGW
jgi:hypothetical protein